MELKLVLTAAGGAGTSTASGNTEAPIKGWIEAIAVKYTTAPVTTTVTITENDNFLSRSILAIPAGNTNTVFYPIHPVVNQSAAAVTNSWQLHFVQYSMNVAVAAANNGTIVEVHFYLSNEFWV